MSWARLMNLLMMNLTSLSFAMIRGDISEMVVKGHVTTNDGRLEYKLSEKASVASLIMGLVSPDDPSDIVFVESLQAEQCSEVQNGEVVNILGKGELLYPACFALSPVENVLRAFINLKLAEIDEQYKGGVIGFLLEQMRTDSAMEIERAQKFFVPFQGNRGGRKIQQPLSSRGLARLGH